MKTAQECLIVNLKRLRKDRGFTQLALAEAIDIALRSYQKYEQGETFPDDQNLDKLARALKVSVGDLFAGPTHDDMILGPRSAAVIGRINAPTKVGDMTPEQMEALVARASKRDGTINLENQRMRQRLTLIPDVIFENWSAAEEEVQNLILYLLTWDDEFRDKVPRSIWKHVHQLGVQKRPSKGRA